MPKFPKYPFDPPFLDALPEPMAELFREFGQELLEGICSRFKISGQLNEVTVDYIRALRAQGIDLKDIERAIRETAGISEKELKKLLDDVVERNQRYYTEVIDLAKVTKPAKLVEEADIDAIKRQTLDEFKNLTRSMGFLVDKGRTMLPPAKAYQWALDKAALKVQSGAVSYNEAIRGAVKQLADSGLKVVDYESGHKSQIDVAARRAIMTGVNQINQKYREESMDYLETDLVEVTAHRGARDIDGPKGWENHKKWQGKVYRWKKKRQKLLEKIKALFKLSKGDYPDFEDTCGYGDVQGIGGANCRHSYWPFVEGVMERTWTDEELENIDPPPFEFEGKTYTAYEATQKQREIEATLRMLRREETAFEAAGLAEDAQAARIRIGRLNQEYEAFSEAAGLPLQRERMEVLYTDRTSEERAATLKTRREAEAPIRNAIRSGEYPLKLSRQKQERHMQGTAWPGRSVITIHAEELQEIVNSKAGSGMITFDKNGNWDKKEVIHAGRIIGYTINKKGDIIYTSKMKIHYSNTGTHAVPFSGVYKP